MRSPTQIMPSTSPKTTTTILDTLRQSLDRVLTTLNQKWTETPLSIEPLGPISIDDERRSFLLGGPNDLSIEVRLAAFDVDDDRIEVQVKVDDGPIHRFTSDASRGTATQAGAGHDLDKKVSAVLRREIEPRLGQQPGPRASDERDEYVPQMDLDRKGSIQRVNTAAQSVLEYTSKDEIEPNFFSHVDGHNLRRVMRDLAQMVSEGMNRARWLLRLQTGNNRWRWFRVLTRNKLRTRGVIRLYLRPLDRH